MEFTLFKELTQDELRDARRLAAGECANFDRGYGCLLLGGKCFIQYGIAYADSALCKYFRDAVLPMAPKLEALFSADNTAGKIKRCTVCGSELFGTGNRAKYCKPCARRAHQRQNSKSYMKRRSKSYK